MTKELLLLVLLALSSCQSQGQQPDLPEIFQEPPSNVVKIVNGSWTRLSFTIAYPTSVINIYEISIRLAGGMCPQFIDIQDQSIPFQVYHDEDTECPMHFYEEQAHTTKRCDKLLMFVQGKPELDGHVIQACLITVKDDVPDPADISLNYTLQVTEPTTPPPTEATTHSTEPTTPPPSEATTQATTPATEPCTILVNNPGLLSDLHTTTQKIHDTGQNDFILIIVLFVAIGIAFFVVFLLLIWFNHKLQSIDKTLTSVNQIANNFSRR